MKWNQIPIETKGVLRLDERGEWIGDGRWIARIGEAVHDLVVWEQSLADSGQRRELFAALFPKLIVAKPEDAVFARARDLAHSTTLPIAWEREPWCDDTGRRSYKLLAGDPGMDAVAEYEAWYAGTHGASPDDCAAAALEARLYLPDDVAGAFGLTVVYAAPWSSVADAPNFAMDAPQAHAAKVIVAQMQPPKGVQPSLDFSDPDEAPPANGDFETSFPETAKAIRKGKVKL